MTEKIYILHENDEWTNPLCEALDELEQPYELWHLHEGQFNLMKEPPQGIFYNRMSASSHTRGHRYAPEYTAAILTWLEAHNRKIFNGSRALSLEVSKVAQYLALEAFGIQTPKTIAASGQQHLVEAASQSGLSSFITKHNRAGKGLGVQLFHSVNELEAFVNSSQFEPSIDGITLIQQYIKSPNTSILRYEFVNGKFLYTVKVDTSEGFELCPADSCQIGDQFCPTTSQPKAKFEIVDEGQADLIAKYEAFLKANHIHMAGIECIMDENGGWYTYDVNTNTNYNPQAEAIHGQFGMKEIAKTLQAELLALKEQRSTIK
ncbi:ATP-grasp domain-containing protein [Alkalihalobacillus pseudalcaliphilus]|uniref:ATP-grasp domain-containing protein n=1 Tax=Alkalihalobacillus pseudalcaliphilus TaxID=79884 RepID=UPI00064DAFFC|nr:alpha-L-glutamate ligase [Alkalihalobacillus pseudalcaliphilus]KMK78189.1 alpha-L-glutamate ligase [Alkalihalobacillus pseudalcaliphilus]